MAFLTQGKTNWKFLLIVVIIAAIVGGWILGYLRITEVTKEPITEEPVIEESEQLTCEEIERSISKNFCFIKTAVDFRDSLICNNLVEIDVENIKEEDSEVSLEYLTSPIIIEYLTSREACKHISNPSESWRAYQNKEYGWEIKVPNNFIIKEHENKVEFISPEDIIALITPRRYLGEFFPYNFFAIKIIPIEITKTLEKWVEENYKVEVEKLPFDEEIIVKIYTDDHHPFPFLHSYYDFSFERTKIGENIPTIKIKDQGTMFKIGLIYVKHGDKIIEFISWGSRSDTSLFNQILPTFSFIE